MNKRDTGFRKRACKKRTKQNCHLFWREMISKLPRQYTHMITRDTTYETIFFATKHSTWLLFVNTQLGLHHITCFKLIHRNPQNGQFGCSSCAAMLSFSFRWLLFLNCNCNFVGQQFLNEAMTSAHFGLPIVPTREPPLVPTLLSFYLAYLNTIYFQF